jgi:DNA-binding protein Fis
MKHMDPTAKWAPFVGRVVLGTIIDRTMTAAAGNRSRAARVLGLSRTTLFDRVKKYDRA